MNFLPCTAIGRCGAGKLLSALGKRWEGRQTHKWNFSVFHFDFWVTVSSKVGVIVQPGRIPLNLGNEVTLLYIHPNPSGVWPLSVMLIEQSPLGGSPGPLVGVEDPNAAKDPVGRRAGVLFPELRTFKRVCNC